MENSSFIDLISQPWHWAVGGLAITLLSLVLTWMGKAFAVSSTFKVACAYLGASKKSTYFKLDLKSENWRIFLIIGGVIGGYIAATWLQSPGPVAISPETVNYLDQVGIAYPEADSKNLGFVPTSIFNFSNWKGVIFVLIGGFFVGFGARYAEGCTSGHAITGLSHLSLPSLITVIGFFVGGLFMTWLVLPYLLPLLH